MSGEIERRVIGGVVKVVEVETRGEGAAKKKTKKITGYAAVFDSLSDDLGGFREVIMPGAFDRALREAHDVRALIDHVPSLILGRTKADTLDLAIDDHGLRMEITPPNTQPARDLLESIERGDVTGASFGFRTLTDDWRMEEGEAIRELKDLELFDVSVVTFPAYPATEVSARARAKALEVRAAASTPPAPESEPEPEPEPTPPDAEPEPESESEPEDEPAVVDISVNEAVQRMAAW